MFLFSPLNLVASLLTWAIPALSNQQVEYWEVQQQKRLILSVPENMLTESVHTSELFCGRPCSLNALQSRSEDFTEVKIY